MTHGTALLLLGLLCPCLASLALDVVAIDGKSYSEVDLTGYTKAETEEAFLAEVAKLSDKDFGAFLGDRDMPGETPEAEQHKPSKTPAEARKAAAAKLFEREYTVGLLSTVESAILSKALDRLVEAHGLVTSDYVDIEALNRAMARQRQLIEFFTENKTADRARAYWVYEEACRRYGLAVSRQEFEMWPPGLLRLPSNGWLVQWTLRNDRYREARAKAAVLGYLLQPTCEPDGFYGEKAASIERFLDGGLLTMVVSGYTGDASALDRLLSAGGTQGGVGRDLAVAWFRVRCAIAGVPVEIRNTFFARDEFERMVLDGPVPPVGVFCQADAGTWRAFLPRDPAWQTLPDPAQQRAARKRALKLAVRTYLPTVTGFEPHYRYDETHILTVAGGLTDPMESLAPRMTRTEDPVLKPYPDAPFREYAEGRAWSQTWLARLTASVVGGDTAQQGDLLGELLEHAGSRKTTAGRRLAEKTLETAVRYAGLADAVKERAARELVTLRAAPPSAP
jgi:hypothetical protein